MKIRMLLLLVLVIIFIGSLNGPLVSQEPVEAGKDEIVPFDTSADLEMRHPELFEDEESKLPEWIKENGLRAWWESDLSIDEDDVTLVNVKSLDGTDLWIGKIETMDDGSNELIDFRTFDLSTAAQEKSEAVRTVFNINGEGSRIQFVRPYVDFGSDPLAIGWEVGVEKNKLSYIYKVSPSGEAALQQKESGSGEDDQLMIPCDPPSGSPDSCGDNELHHSAAFRLDASDLSQGALVARDKARNIADGLRKKFRYDAGIPGIIAFVWADAELSRNRNRAGRFQGICDEYSVMAVTFLRALGVPARLKVATWDTKAKLIAGGKGYKRGAHAFVEFFDGSNWRHLDPLAGKLDDPGMYRRGGYKNILVMDVGEPDDTRSGIDSFGLKDPSGDGKLNIYHDLKIAPAYPGGKLPGYSHP